MKLYNFGTDEQTQKPNGEVHYEVVRTGTADPIVSLTEDVGQNSGRFGEPGDAGEIPAAGEICSGLLHPPAENYR